MAIVEPQAGEFFATASGVCVYVNVDRRAVRVHFASLDGLAAVEGDNDDGARVAMAAASNAFEKHKRQIQPLFERIAREAGGSS